MELSGRRPMAGTRCLLGFLVVGVLAVQLFLPAGAARAISGATLKFDPPSGPQGSPVTVFASGFGRCLPDEPSPTVEPSPPPEESSEPPDDPGVEPAALRVRGGTVEFLWDGSDVVAQATDSGSGEVSAGFTVPESAIGMHRVVARCVGMEEQVRADGSFEVTRSEDPVIVPSVIGMDRDEAEKALIGAELSVGRISGNGDTVRSQDPGPGSEVERGSHVDIDLGTIATPQTPQTPRTVVVPKLIGREVDDVTAILGARGLVLGPVSGKGEIVRDQRPTPGSRVPAGSAVSVSTRRDVEPPVMIRVPDVVGSTVSAARSALAAVGLKLGGTPEDDRDVATQQPSAGTFVAAGSVVTVTLAPIRLVRVPDLVGSGVADARTALSAVDLVLGGTLAAGRAIVSQQPPAGTLVPAGTRVTVTFAQPFSWASAAGLLAVLSGSAAVAARMVRQRLDHRWVRRLVSVVATPAPVVTPAITETGADSQMPVVRIEPHGDAGRHTFEEV